MGCPKTSKIGRLVTVVLKVINSDWAGYTVCKLNEKVAVNDFEGHH